MLKGSEKGNKWAKVWTSTKSYTANVWFTYLKFAGPFLMLVAVSMSVDVADQERFGLGWLHVTALKDDKVREEQFPSYEPTSAAQRRRNDAASRAGAIDYAANAM